MSPQNPYQNTEKKKFSSSFSTASFPLLSPQLKKLISSSDVTKELPNINSLIKPVQNNVKVSKNENFPNISSKYESNFDDFMVQCLKMPLYQCLEKQFEKCFSVSTVICWEDVPSLHILHSKSLNKTNDHSRGLIGFTFFSRTNQVFANPTKHPAFDPEMDTSFNTEGYSEFLFPLCNDNGGVYCIIQVARNYPFDDQGELSYVKYFQEKFLKLFSIIRTNHINRSLVLELFEEQSFYNFLYKFHGDMKTEFNCRSAELWKYDIRNQTLYRYVRQKEEVFMASAGIAGESIRNCMSINCLQNRLLSCYHHESDGEDIESVLCVPYSLDKVIISIVLRGGRGKVFTQTEEESLKGILPYAAQALLRAEERESHDLLSIHEDDRHFISSLSQIMEYLVIPESINDTVKQLLTGFQTISKSENTNILFFNNEISLMVDFYNSSIKYSVKSIAYTAYSTQNICIFPEPTSEPNIVCQNMLIDGKRVKNAIAIPIITLDGTLHSVFYSQNKDCKPAFSDNDIQYAKVVSKIIGVMVSYQGKWNQNKIMELNIFERLKSAFAPINSQTIVALLKEILVSIRRNFKMDGVSLYLAEPQGLRLFMNEGVKPIPELVLGTNIYSTSIKQRKPIYVNDTRNDPRFSSLSSEYSKSALSIGSIPILSPNHQVIAVCLFFSYDLHSFTQNEIGSLNSLSYLLSILLSDKKPVQMHCAESLDYIISLVIPQEEMRLMGIPKYLALDQGIISTIMSHEFCALDFSLIEQIQIAFQIFSHFSIFSDFHIPSEKFFRFLYDIYDLTNRNPYHCFSKSIDSLQSVAQLLMETPNHNLKDREIFTLLLASLFTGIYRNTEKNDLAMMSFANRCIGLEVEAEFQERWIVSTRVLSSKDYQLLSFFGAKNLEDFWVLFSDIIGYSGSLKHYKFIYESTNIPPQSHKEKSVFFMRSMIKISSIRPLIRPYSSSNKWIKQLYEETVKDNQVHEFLSNIIGFYNFIALPLIEHCDIPVTFKKKLINTTKDNIIKWNSRQ